MNRSTFRSPSRASRRMWWRAGTVALVCIVGVSFLVWRSQNAREMTRLGRDTRVVVRIPETVIDRLTADEIHEEFPIEESTDEMEVTGTAKAAGHVTLRIRRHPEHDRHDDAMVHVEVVGHTDNHLVGHHGAVVVVGAGRGEFEAHKQVHFDGFHFTAEGPTTVEATHHTEIVDVPSSTTSTIQGAVRLLANRRARAALPDLNRLAAQRIEEKVQQRVDEVIGEAMTELNRLNKLDETVATLHPDSDQGHIDVDSGDGFVQAALVPEGGTAPHLPAERPTALEVWIRLTRSQRIGLNLVSYWRDSHRLFRRFVPEEVAEQMPGDVRMANIDGWTRLRVGPQSDSPKIAAGVGAN